MAEKYILWCSKYVRWVSGKDCYVCWDIYGRIEVRLGRKLNVSYWTENIKLDPTIEEVIGVNDFVLVNGGWEECVSSVEMGDKVIEEILG